MDAEKQDKEAEAQINVVIGTLLEAAADKNESVHYAVNRALKKIANKHPNELLQTICFYTQRNSKLSNEHLAALFQPMDEVCQENIIAIDGDTVLLLINFCVEEMTKNPEYVPGVQMAASAVLVALGTKHCIQVMEGVLKKFVAGTGLHYTIPHTMGSLASSNPFAVLPFLKSILGTMLPMLGMARSDHLKQSFAFALGRFCEAINEYMSNIKHAPDPTIQKDMFSTEIGIAYDVLSTTWLQSREPKVVECVLHALGSMYSILTPDKVAEQTPKMLTTLLFMCKKQKDCYSVTQCLASVLNVVLEQNNMVIESHLDQLLHTLSDIVSPVPDYGRPESVKNQGEVFRCYDHLGKHFCDKTADHLVSLLKNNNEKDRIKALLIVTHLVNSSDCVIKSRIPDLIIILKHMLGESNMKVKIVLLKAIVAFAYHGHFFNPESNIFIEFIIKLYCTQNAVNSKGILEINETDWAEVQRTCDNSLYLLTSSVLELENSFWILFHGCILSKEYTKACCTILKCLTNLASRKKDTFNNNDENMINSQAVFVRCVSLLANPLSPRNSGLHILNFFKNYSPFVYKHLRPIWELQVPQLLAHLEEYHDNWNQDDWEGKVLQFIAVTIKEVDEMKWTENLATVFTSQFDLYNFNSSEKGFSLKCLATVLCQMTDAKFVKQDFDALLSSARLGNIDDSLSCAKAVGICARVHMHHVLNKLNAMRKEELLKKTHKFLNFNFIKDVKHEVEIERLRYTIIACYAELVLEAPAEKLLLTIEHEILDWVVNELRSTKDFEIKNICIFAIGKIADAMHPNRNTLHIRMQSRNDVLELVLNQLKLHSGPEYIELCPVILPVVTSLVKLRNDLEPDQRITIIKNCFDMIYNAASIYCKLSSSNNNKDISYGDLKLAPFVYNSFDNLNILSRTLLLQSMNPATLDDILTMLEPWLNKKKAEQRLPAIENLKNVLDCYLSNMKFAYETPSKFGQTGFILGRIIPRCTDPNTSIRLVALECVRLVLCIAARYEGHMSDYNTEIGNRLQSLNTDIVSSNPKILYNVTSELAKIIAEFLPPFQLMHFAESLLDGLLDHEPSSSSGGSVTLNMFLKLKGGELYNHVTDLVIKLLQFMNLMTCNKTRTSSVRSVLALAIHHPKIVVAVLLTNPLPYDTCVSDCWMQLAQDTDLAIDILEQFKRLFSTIPLYEEQQNAERLRICTLQPLAAVCALHEMFRNSQIQEVISNQFPELFVILSMIFSSYIGTSPPIHVPQQINKKEKYSIVPNRDAYKLVPAKIALDTLKLMILDAKNDRVVEVFLQGGVNLESCTSITPFVEIMPFLAESIFAYAAPSVARIVTAMNQYSNSSVDAQRITVNAFFVEVMKHKGNGQLVLVESVITTLLNGQSDSCAMVRQLALRGLGYVSNLDEEQCSKHCSFVFTALMQGLDDHDMSNSETNIPLEAMVSFSKMLQEVDERHVQTIQVSAAVRIKAFYERDDAKLRCAAFRLFGDLAKSFRKGASGEAFREQIDGNFVSLLLHLIDEDADVIKACKYTLRQIGPLLDANKVNNMIQDHLIDEANLHFTNFISDLIKIMTKEIHDRFPFFVMNSLSFLKSQWSEIRGNAALMIGLLYNNLPAVTPETTDSVQLDTVCYRLMQLLQDENPEVRAKTVQGLSYLFVS